MLDERWRTIVERFPDRLAVLEVRTGRSLSFASLAAAADAQQPPTAPILFPSGHAIPFLLAVLLGWRTRTPVCPLEPHQPTPHLPPPPADIAHLKFTSGSTGQPRAIALTEAQLAADADHIIRTMGLHPECPNVGLISLAHSYGFSNLVTPLLLHGIPLILAESPLPAAMQAAARMAPGIVLPAVPALWATWLKADAIPANITLALSAGAPLPLPLEHEAFERHRLKIHNFLGASECGGIAFDRTPEPRTDATCVGTPLEGVGLGIAEDGCLLVHGPAVAQGYFPAPHESLQPGRYHSSDLVALGSDRNLRILGRATDRINTAGRKVAPEAIERALLEHAGVSDCLAFGIPGMAHRGEDIGVAYVLRRPVSETELRQHLLERLPAWQVPRRWWSVPTLEPDHRGKRSRPDWRNRLLREDGLA